MKIECLNKEEEKGKEKKEEKEIKIHKRKKI